MITPKNLFTFYQRTVTRKQTLKKKTGNYDIIQQCIRKQRKNQYSNRFQRKIVINPQVLLLLQFIQRQLKFQFQKQKLNLLVYNRKRFQRITHEVEIDLIKNIDHNIYTNLIDFRSIQKKVRTTTPPSTKTYTSIPFEFQQFFQPTFFRRQQSCHSLYKILVRQLALWLAIVNIKKPQEYQKDTKCFRLE